MILRKILKITAWILSSLVLLFLILLLIIQIPAVQTSITHQVSDYLSKELKTKVSVGKVKLTVLLHAVIEDVDIYDLHQKQMIHADKIDLKINSLGLSNHKMQVEKIKLERFKFALAYYKGEDDINLQFLIDYFSDTTSTEKSNWKFIVKNAELKNSSFSYNQYNQVFSSSGMDYAHLDIKNINLKIENFRTSADTLFADIKNLSALEKCGFELQDFRAAVKISSAGLMLENLHIKTPGSDINGKMHFDYAHWIDWVNYVQKMKMIAQIKPSKLAMHELSAFAPALAAMFDTIDIQGEFKGTVASFKAKDLKLQFGKKTVFNGSVKMDGLPDFDRTFMMFKADKLISDKEDIENFALPYGQKIILPENLKNIGEIKAKGRFTGYYYDFVSNASFVTNYGQLSTDISLQPLQGTRKLAYNGNLTIENFEFGRLLNSGKYIGKVNCVADIHGIGLDDSTNATFNLNISTIELGDYEYKNILAIGKIEDKKISADVSSNNDKFAFDLNGSYYYGSQLPEYEIHGKIIDSRLARIIQSNMDTLGDISAIINAKISGNNIENIEADITIDSLEYQFQEKSIFAKTLTLNTHLSQNFRSLTFSSPFLDFTADGNYSFDNIGKDFYYFSRNIHPAFFDNSKNDSLLKSANYIPTSSIQIGIHIKNPNPLLQVLYPALRIAQETRLKLTYSGISDNLDLNLKSPEMLINGIYFKNINLISTKENGILKTNFKTDFIEPTDSMRFENLSLSANSQNDSLNFRLNWGVSGSRINRGLLEGDIITLGKSEFRTKIASGELIFNDSLWMLNNNSTITYLDKRIEVDNLVLHNNDNKISSQGVVSNDPNDKLFFNFDHFNLSTINPFIRNWVPELNGIINGEMEVSDIWASPGFFANLFIEKFNFNHQYLGNVDLQSRWSSSNNAVILDMSLENPLSNIGSRMLDAHGFFYTGDVDNKIDLGVQVYDFPAKTIDYLLTSFSSQVDGKLNGDLRVLGTSDHIILSGKLLADIKSLKIDYTNTIYSFKDYIYFDDGIISLKDVKCYDSNYQTGKAGSQAITNFTLKHTNFSDFYLDLNVKPTEAMVLNTNYLQNPLYYGKAVASGALSIKGPVDDLKMSIDVESKKGTDLAISIEDDTEVEKFDFLTFKKPEILADSIKSIKETEEPFYLNLDFNAKLNQDASIQLVMNRELNDIIVARGYGDIKMNINQDGDVKIYGKYNITKGDYNFVFNNVINKEFQIKEGSYVLWDGSLDNARVDIVAQYKLYAKLSNLLSSIDSNSYNRQAKVNCLIYIKGDLYDPDISFAIELPDEDANTKEIANRVLSINDDKNSNNYFLNLNFMSLLVAGTFQPPTGQGFDLNTQAISTNNATELLANQLGSILGKLNKDLDIDLNWNTGDAKTTQEITAAFTYSAMNNRLIINGIVGGGGEIKGSQNNRIVGDFDIQYKLEEDGNFLVKVYNKTNYDDPLTHKAPYTQGVGIAYRKEFDSLKDIFKKSKKKL